MPLLQFYTNFGQLSAEDKGDLVSVLTRFYARIMPDFFVNIVFNEYAPDNFYMGGKPTNGTFVRFTADHIAVNWEKGSKGASMYLNWLGEVFTERFESRGWTWEFHVTESDKKLWRIQSIVPPPVGSDEMQAWRRLGKAIPWENVE